MGLNPRLCTKFLATCDTYAYFQQALKERLECVHLHACVCTHAHAFIHVHSIPTCYIQRSMQHSMLIVCLLADENFFRRQILLDAAQFGENTVLAKIQLVVHGYSNCYFCNAKCQYDVHDLFSSPYILWYLHTVELV